MSGSMAPRRIYSKLNGNSGGFLAENKKPKWKTSVNLSDVTNTKHNAGIQMYSNLQSPLTSKFHGIRLWWMEIEYRYWAYLFISKPFLNFSAKQKDHCNFKASQSNRDKMLYPETKHHLGKNVASKNCSNLKNETLGVNCSLLL